MSSNAIRIGLRFGVCFGLLVVSPLHAEDLADSAGGAGAPVATPGGIDQSAFNRLTFLPPELVEQMDSRRLAEMIVARLHHFCDKDRDPDAKPFPEGEDDILMLVPAQHLASIARLGFKNQHQTSSTNGCNCKGNRVRNEMVHVGLGLPYTHKTRELLPKYAMKTFSHDRHGTYRPPFNYGNVIIKFKPEVRRRTTWSYTDSLGHLSPLRTHFVGPKGLFKCFGYCEAQIWGELDFTDVESIRIPEDIPMNEDMKNLGVPIYTYARAKPAPPPAGPYGYPPAYAPYPGYASGPPPVGYAAPVVSAAPAPSVGSLLDISFKAEPIYQPKIAKPPAALKLPLDVAERELSSGFVTKSKILASHILSQLSTEELIKRYQARAPELDDLGDSSIRLLAELSGRPKNPELLKFLTDTATNAPRPMARDMALTGLLALPWAQIKPLILERLRFYRDADPYDKYFQAFEFILAQHLDDPDVKDYYAFHRSSPTRKAGRPVCNESIE